MVISHWQFWPTARSTFTHDTRPPPVGKRREKKNTQFSHCVCMYYTRNSQVSACLSVCWCVNETLLLARFDHIQHGRLSAEKRRLYSLIVNNAAALYAMAFDDQKDTIRGVSLIVHFSLLFSAKFYFSFTIKEKTKERLFIGRQNLCEFFSSPPTDRMWWPKKKTPNEPTNERWMPPHEK